MVIMPDCESGNGSSILLARPNAMTGLIIRYEEANRPRGASFETVIESEEGKPPFSTRA